MELKKGDFLRMSFLKFWVKSKKKKKDLPPEVLADNGSVFLPGQLPSRSNRIRSWQIVG